MARYRITIFGRDRGAMLDLVRKYHIEVSDHGIRGSDSRGFTVDAIVEEAEIAILAGRGYHVTKHEDVDQVGRERQQEVGKGNRYLKPAPR